MPCTDGGVPYPEPTEQEINARGELSHRQLEALLCGILTVYPSLLNWVDWSEVGFAESVAEKWWKLHQAKDAKRKGKAAQAHQKGQHT